MVDAFVLFLLVLFPIAVASVIGLSVARFRPNLSIKPITMLSALPLSALLRMLSLITIATVATMWLIHRRRTV